MQQTPKLGQTVHYHDQNGRTFAAKVIKVHGPYCVNLLAFDDGTGYLGAPTVVYCDVTWATTYGYPSAWSFEEASVAKSTSAPAPYRPTIPAPEPIIAIVQPPATVTATSIEPPASVTAPTEPASGVTLAGLLDGIKQDGQS